MYGTSTSRKGSALALVLLAASCTIPPAASNKPSAPPLIPTPTAVGVPSGEPESTTIDRGGGTFSAAGERLVVVVPPGTVSGPTTFSVTPISNRAPGGVGQAFRIQAAAPLATPVTLTFKGLDTYPSGTNVASLSIATQDAGGFWRKVDTVTRDAAANTVSATVSHFSDWSLVLEGTPALRGTFTLNQNVGTPFSATGEGVLYLRTDVSSTEPWYLFTGTITAPPQVTIGSATCTPDAPTQTLLPNTAEVHAAQFRWGLNARWTLTCTDGVTTFPDELVTRFDTLRINLACPGSYVGTQVNGPEFIQGGYASDCGVTGTVSASWDFRACTAGLACETGDPCRTGVISCAGPLPACVDNGNAPDGTSCGVDSVCSGGACVACVEGSACTPTNSCHTGTLSCSGGLVCNDTGTPVGDGTSCGIDAVCGGGVCNPCVAGEACVSADPCRTAALTCNTGFPVCTNDGLEPDGTSCGTNLVCSGGACVSCTAGATCTPQNPCHGGVLSCDQGPVCNDAGTVLSDGTSCGVDAVCGGGTCNPCEAGASCATSTPCRTAVITCNTGFSVCTDSGNEPDGTSCGSGAVCDEGACVACVAGTACTPPTSPCHVGTLSCSAGPVCDDTGAFVGAGTSCGDNAVCSTLGTCTPCTSGQSCTPSNPCKTAAIACDSGGPVCTDNGNEPDGTSCGDGLVCDDGACVPCAAGTACVPPNPCHTGTQSCSAGPICDDAGGIVPDGTSCGVDAVCGGGTCTPCTAGETCTPSGPCKTAAIACDSGAPLCTDTGNLADGTSCGVDAVCGGGVCNACVAGATCSTNPNPCVQGAVDCTTGFERCVDTATPLSDGTNCGADLVCDAGACVACVAGTACAPPTSPCHVGTLSCSAGPVCDDTGALVTDGTSCGTNAVCGGGVCNACIAGATCSTNPNPCVQGAVDCTTGFERCVDTATPLSDGTNCGADLVCDAGACVACVAGTACTPPTSPCHVGTLSCSAGPVCDDTGAAVADGTDCGGGFVCTVGVCGPPP